MRIVADRCSVVVAAAAVVGDVHSRRHLAGDAGHVRGVAGRGDRRLSRCFVARPLRLRPAVVVAAAVGAGGSDCCSCCCC